MPDKAVEIACKLVEARRTLMRLFGERYPQMVSQWRELIRDVAVDPSCGGNPVAALHELLRMSTVSAETALWLCAATADECERAPEVARG